MTCFVYEQVFDGIRSISNDKITIVISLAKVLVTYYNIVYMHTMYP